MNKLINSYKQLVERFPVIVRVHPKQSLLLLKLYVTLCFSVFKKTDSTLRPSARNTTGNIAILAILIACYAFKSISKTPAMDPCLKEVKDIYDRMYTTLPQAGKTYFFDYRVVSTLSAKDKDGKNIVNHSDIKLYIAKGQYRFITEAIAVYQDQENKFTVLPAKKTVYWGDSDMNINKEGHLEKMKKIQDTIFKYAEVIQCENIKQGNADKMIKVRLKEKLAQYLQIKQVTYSLDSKQKEVKKMQIECPGTKEVLAMEFIFNEADYDYKKTTLGLVKPMFIEGSDKLTGAYKEYKLIDVRKKIK